MAPVPSDPDQASNLTSGLTSVLACMIPVLALVYIGGVLWTLDYRNRRQTPLNKTYSVGSHRYAPSEYNSNVFGSLFNLEHRSCLCVHSDNQPGGRTITFIMRKATLI
jgi:hypothetical protein